MRVAARWARCECAGLACPSRRRRARWWRGAAPLDRAGRRGRLGL